MKAPRKQMLVNWTIQGRMIGRLVFYWAVYHMVLWHGLFVVRYVQYRLDAMSDVQTRSFRDVYVSFLGEYAALAVVAALMSPVVFFDMFKFSHRVAGPLVRFDITLKRLMKGEVVPAVKLRDGDLLTDFEMTFNQFLDYYGKQKAGVAVEVKAATTSEAAVGDAEPRSVPVAVLPESEYSASTSQKSLTGSAILAGTH